ncbi:maleylpyruvate isomerase family mycothiol-dependent enzyme [Kocuria aegyptia]|uniref:TIGR03086 family metal-binding protein n=1 Tax=Kocuria aegyptia TaxID=330943 RepID=A0ABP4WIH9_9MICC
MSSELFRAATDYVRDVTSGLSNDALGFSTPCDGWDTGTVVLHLADVAAALVSLVESGEMQMPDSPRTDAADPVAKFHHIVAQLEAALSTAPDTERAEAAMQAGTIEFTMHGWDIGMASDHGHKIPKQLAGEVLELATALISDDARGTNFAARVNAPTTALMSDRLVAFLGRRPVELGVVDDRDVSRNAP